MKERKPEKLLWLDFTDTERDPSSHDLSIQSIQRVLETLVEEHNIMVDAVNAIKVEPISPVATSGKKTVTIQVTAYFDKDGEPTCAVDFSSGKVCEFFRTSEFGTKEHCLYGDGQIDRKGDDGLGLLIPCKECIIHDM